MFFLLSFERNLFQNYKNYNTKFYENTMHKLDFRP